MDNQKKHISIELVFTFHNMTPINFKRLGTQNLLTPIDDFHIGDILFFCSVKGMTWDKKTLSLTILLHPPTLQILSCITPRRARKIRDSVLSHQLRISSYSRVLSNRVSQMGIVG